MSRLVGSPSRSSAALLTLMLTSVLVACSGSSSAPTSTLQAQEAIAFNTNTPPTAEQIATTVIGNVDTPTTTLAPPPVPGSPEALFASMGQALTREGEIYHATVTQVSKSAGDNATTPHWSGEIWLDVGRDVGRIEFRPDSNAPAPSPWGRFGLAPGTSTTVVAGNEFYLALEQQQIWNSSVGPCPEMDGFSLVVYLVCGSAISPWAPDYPFFGGSPIWPDQHLVLEQDVEYHGRPAIAVSFDVPPTTHLYLDAETYLPLAWEADQMESGTLVTTFSTEFIPALSLDADIFAPASVGYADPAAPSGMVAFMRPQNESPDIFVVNADGSGEQNLTNHPAADIFPSWSPDGSQLAFASARSGDTEIYSMHADGSHVNRLTDNPTPDFKPVWSPDGTRIVFQSDRDGTTISELYVMDVDGANVNRISSMDHAEFPAWSPDGSQIAFSARDLYVVDADGSQERRLTEGMLTSSPQWTTDGRQLVFSIFDLDAGTSDIAIINADGSELTVLTPDSTYDLLPHLSPDGRQIVFLSNRGELSGEPQLGMPVYIMNLDGSEQMPLIYPEGIAYCGGSCTWASSGTHFAFVVLSLSGGEDEGSTSAWEGSTDGLYLVSLDGRIVTRLVTGVVDGVDWSP